MYRRQCLILNNSEHLITACTGFSWTRSSLAKIVCASTKNEPRSWVYHKGVWRVGSLSLQFLWERRASVDAPAHDA